MSEGADPVTMATVYALVTYPPPELHGQPACTHCRGAGVTGEQFSMDGGPLLVDVFCCACGGCGRREHSSCTARSPCAETGLLDRDDQDEAGELCPSCQGREWNAVQGFDDQGQDGVELTVLRVPCGCTTDRVELIQRG